MRGSIIYDSKCQLIDDKVIDVVATLSLGRGHNTPYGAIWPRLSASLNLS